MKKVNELTKKVEELERANANIIDRVLKRSEQQKSGTDALKKKLAEVMIMYEEEMDDFEV
jgi:hypothetical protein